MSRARRAPTNVPVTPPTDLDAMLKRLHLPTVRRLYPELARFPFVRTIDDFGFTFQ